MSKIIVVYYSFEGNTKSIAEFLAKDLSADILEVKPNKEIKSKGFGKYFWGGRQVIMGKKPELKPLSKNLDEYDIILVGTPIWAGTYAPPIKTLLEENYIEGKKVAYFYSHQGGPGKAVDKAKSVIQKKNTFIGYKDFLSPKENIESSSKEAKRWAEHIIQDQRPFNNKEIE